MHPFPHHYRVRIGIKPEGEVSLDSEGLPQLRSLPPPEWGGPGGYWAPETLLLAALGDCTMMTFRAIAKASRFEWRELSADVEGKLERIDGNARFTEITIRVRLVVPPGADAARARHLLEKSEKGCPVSNSLTASEAHRGRDRRGRVSAIVRQLGRVDYAPTWRAMQALTDARDADTPDELWFLEHEPVFTQGLNGKPEHLLATGDIPVVGIDRGGQVTYHGPGQLVMYALVDLRRRGIGVRELVVALENSVVDARGAPRHRGRRPAHGAGRLRRGAQAREHRAAGPARLQLPRPRPQRGHGPRAVRSHQSLRHGGPRDDAARVGRRDDGCRRRGARACAARGRRARPRMERDLERAAGAARDAPSDDRQSATSTTPLSVRSW